MCCCTCAQVNKHKLVEDLGVPYRDLRMLDPLVTPYSCLMSHAAPLGSSTDRSWTQVPMPYPSAIFIREHAIIVNLESIKMLICTDQVKPGGFCTYNH